MNVNFIAEGSQLSQVKFSNGVKIYGVQSQT